MNQSDTKQFDVLTLAIQDYFAACRQRIPSFVNTHFKYPGTWQTNRQALGWDLIRAPINLFWAPFYLCLQLLAWLLNKLGLKQASQCLRKTPSGFTTDIQRYLSAQVFTHLLGRHRCAEKDALFQAFSKALTDAASDKHHDTRSKAIDTIVRDALEQYRITRTASADISNSLASTLVGAFALQKFTPGGFAIGLAIAGWLSNQWAIDHFIFGNWLGGLYYALFPPTPSLGVTIASVGGVLTLLSVVATFSGLITDPIQTWTGLHRRRLLSLINRLEADFLQGSIGGYRPKDQFVARILEAVDTVKAYIYP